MEYVTIDRIKPAEYNPRLLTEDAKVNLKGSLSELGFILPIIVNKNNETIIAGHQRSKCASEMGIKQFPCYYVHEKISIVDEVLFNQCHNGTEGEPEDCGFLNKDMEDGFYDAVPLQFFSVNGFKAVKMDTIAKLILKFGNVFCAIVVGRKVLLGNSYLAACRLLNIGCNISKISADKEEAFNKWFSKQYGVFNYDNIKKKDFIQGLAQPKRDKVEKYSCLYKLMVIPFLGAMPKTTSVLDFGCGKGLSKNWLIKEGYNNVVGLEFFNHNQIAISVSRGNSMIDNLFSYVKKNGLFDVTVCEAVINSVNCKEAANAVLDCLNVFTKIGGRIFLSGRRMEHEEYKDNQKFVSDKGFHLNYFDKDGFSGYMVRGNWFFQLFLRDSDLKKICDERGWVIEVKKHSSSYFFLQVRKTKNLPIERSESALRYEFNLSLPNEQRYNRDDEAVKVFSPFL